MSPTAHKKWISRMSVSIIDVITILSLLNFKAAGGFHCNIDSRKLKLKTKLECTLPLLFFKWLPISINRSFRRFITTLAFMSNAVSPRLLDKYTSNLPARPYFLPFHINFYQCPIGLKSLFRRSPPSTWLTCFNFYPISQIFSVKRNSLYHSNKINKSFQLSNCHCRVSLPES